MADMAMTAAFHIRSFYRRMTGFMSDPPIGSTSTGAGFVWKTSTIACRKR